MLFPLIIDDREIELIIERSYMTPKKRSSLKSHGMSSTLIYHIWKAMLKRCNNPNDNAYKNYGGRGIRVCDDWTSFETFYDDMGNRPDGLQLDRIDNDGNYEPSNCRWISRAINNSNPRCTIPESLKRKKSDSCRPRPRLNYLEYIDKKINKWTVLSFEYKKSRVHFKCICSCGIISFVQATAVIYGFSKQCKQCNLRINGLKKKIGGV
jgi:hypothetical protein